MTVRSLVQGWNEFFFKPQPPTPVALFRILYGLLTIANLLMLRPEWSMWYGPHAFMSMETMHTVDKFIRINFFELLPLTNFWINSFFWFFLLVADLPDHRIHDALQLRFGFSVHDVDSLAQSLHFEWWRSGHAVHGFFPDIRAGGSGLVG